MSFLSRLPRINRKYPVLIRSVRDVFILSILRLLDMQEPADFCAARDHPEILTCNAAGPDHGKHVYCYRHRNREQHAQCQTDLTGSMQEKISYRLHAGEDRTDNRSEWLRLP